MKRYGLRDDQFARIEPLLPGRPGTVGRSSELGNRLFVEAVIWKFRSGAPWRDLPERFGNCRPNSLRSSTPPNTTARGAPIVIAALFCGRTANALSFTTAVARLRMDDESVPRKMAEQ